ncbi:class I SAM-dependent methyltransferase [Methylicorpusculum oleiharenae]|uniref:class I SAM-dependent methyltransferase n=1 Tax=Methylicorpusculum oleiharenae TaxID=1338687 RepID=UPI001357FB01|nr:class I SAM-dependent methyltransferase [Methylicorpusculum oleiharenae]MCD2452686.1 class I SAM-dependent methyltransferase [Methylicorpusculum oleiharenae]
MAPKAEELELIEAVTLSHYDQNAEAYWQGTKDHDVTQNYAAFLAPFPIDKKLDILDLGCGPGRDVQYFKSLGHRPIGLDGSEVFCAMARRYSGCEILHQKFLDLELSIYRFDGIFANASLFHVPSKELPHVLDKLHAALRPGGILFLSNPRGNDEGWSGQRYGHFIQLETSVRFLEAAGFAVLNHYYRPSGKPIEEQPWLAIVAQAVNSGSQSI